MRMIIIIDSYLILFFLLIISMKINGKTMKLTKITLAILAIASISACSTTNPNIKKANIEEQYIGADKQNAVIFFGNQLSEVKVSVDSDVAQNMDTLSQRGFSPEMLQSVLRDNLLNSGLYSKGSATGLTLNVLVTNAKVRSAFGAKNFGSLDGSDYLNTNVTITDKSGKVLSSAVINTPKLVACPTTEVNNKVVPDCSESDRVKLMNSYLVAETTDFIRGRFIK